jgi:hypothetical protein
VAPVQKPRSRTGSVRATHTGMHAWQFDRSTVSGAFRGMNLEPFPSVRIMARPWGVIFPVPNPEGSVGKTAAPGVREAQWQYQTGSQ